MKQLSEIKEALVVISDGALNITFGKDLNKTNPNYHDRVSIEIQSGGTEILVKGYKLKDLNITDEIWEDKEPTRFKACCEKLKGFEEKIKITEVKKFSWKTFKREVVKTKRSVYHYEYFNTRYIYKEEFWEPAEYKTNNWVYTEFKESDK